MKKRILALLLSAMLTSSLFVGCGPKKKDETPVIPPPVGPENPPPQSPVEYELIEVEGCKGVFELNEAFTFTGTTFTLRDKNTGEIKEISLTEEMIKTLPDMSTQGQKQITILYEGQEFVFVITVVDSYQKVIEKFLKYLQEYEKGSTDKISVSMETDLISKFLGDSAISDKELSYTLNKSEINNIEGALPNQKEFLEKVYEALTDTLAESGLNISKEQIIDQKLAKFEISTDKLINSAIENIATKAMEDALFDAMLPGTIEETAEMLSNSFSETFGVKTNTKIHFKTLILQAKVKNVEGMKSTVKALIQVIEKESLEQGQVENVAISNALLSFINDESDQLMYNLFVNCFEAMNLTVKDSDGNKVTNYATNKKKEAFKLQVEQMGKTFDKYLNNEITSFELLEDMQDVYINISEIYEYFEENGYTYIEGLNSHILNYNVAVLQLYLDMINNASNLTEEKTTVFKIEKVLFALIGSFVSTTTKEIVKSDPLEEEYNEYEYIDEAIKSVEMTTAYLNAIFAKNREDFNKYISKLTEDEEYYKYYTENGKSCFLTRLLEKTCLEEDFENKEFYAEYYNANKKLTMFLDGIVNEIEQGKLDPNEVVDAYAQYALDCIDLAEKYPEEQMSSAMVSIIASMHSKFQSKEKIQFLIDNIGFNVYEEISLYITGMFDIGDDLVREKIEDVVKENIDYVLNNDDIQNFNMFEEVIKIVLEYRDETLTEAFGEEKSIIVNSIKDLASSIDNAIITGTTENIIECIKTNLPEFTQFIQNEEMKTIVNFLYASGLDIKAITNGLINDEKVAPIVKEVVGIYALQLFTSFGVEYTEENFEIIKANFVEPVYQSMLNDENNEYAWEKLNKEEVVKKLFNTLNALEITVDERLKDIVLYSINDDKSIAENVKEYLYNDENRDEFVNLVINYFSYEELTEEQENELKEYIDALLVDVLNNSVDFETAYDELVTLSKNLSVDEQKLLVGETNLLIKGVYYTIYGDLNQLKILLSEFRDEFSESAIPTEIDAILDVIINEDGKLFNISEIMDRIINSENTSVLIKESLTNLAFNIFTLVGVEYSEENYEIIKQNFIEPTYESMYDEVSGKYSWSNLNKEFVLEKVYDTFDEFNYEYSENLKNLLNACLNSDATIEENFKTYVKDHKNRALFAKEIVKLLEIPDNGTQIQDFEAYFDYILLEMANETLTKEDAYYNFIDLLKSSAIDPNEEMFIAKADFVIKAIYELTQGNVNNVKTLLEEFRKEYPESESVIPMELDFILELATYEANSTMDMVVKILENEDVYQSCILALNEVMVSINPIFGEEGKYEIIEANFSQKILNEIINKKSITPEKISEIYFNTIQTLNSKYSDEIAYNEMVADLVTTMLKINEGENFANGVKINSKVFLQNNKRAIASMLAEILISTVDENKTLEAQQDAEEIFAELIDTFVDEKYEETEVLDKVTDFCNKYYSKDVQTKVYSASALIAIMAGNRDIDYNKLFAFVELPENVTVDYNKLINKLMDETTWEDSIKLSKFEYVINENPSKDSYIGQTYYLTISINMDAQIASLKGDIKFKIDIE